MLNIQEMGIVRGNAQSGFRVTLPELTLNAGEIAAITGISGCGKSTLLEMIGLILKPDHLRYFSLGAEPQNITQTVLNNNQAYLASIRAKKLGFVLQNGGLLPFLTVWQNIQLPRQILHLCAQSTWLDTAIKRLNIQPLLHQYPHQLSIGERQRVAFIRAIAHEPDLLLADEPTAALDPYNANQLFSLIVDIVKQGKMAALIVSHDWSRVEQFQLMRYHAQIQGAESVFIRG